MWNWLKKEKKDLPDFWQNYQAKFREKPSLDLANTRFVVLDTETTGLDQKKDRILSIGAVAIIGNSIDIGDAFEIYLHQETFNPDTVRIHGIRKEEGPQFSEEEAIRAFLDYAENAILVAHHAGFDLGMINQALGRMELPKLKNRCLDTSRLYGRSRIISNFIDRERSYSLDDLAEVFNIDTRDRHTASGDAFITAIAFLKILARHNVDGKLRPKDLFKI